MNHDNGKNEAIERDLSRSLELDLNTWEHLALAAGDIAEAEAAFVRLAEPGSR